MAQEITLYQKCPQCNGAGTFQPAHGPGGVPFTCNWMDCAGSGYIMFGKYTIDPGHNDLMGKLNDIKEKVDEIKEVVDEL